MIVPTMTEQEIYRALYEDHRSTYPKVELFRKKFRTVVLHASKFPICRFYECISDNRNRVVIGFNALKRGQHNNPNIGMHCLYRRREGLYAAVWTLGGRMTLFAPHFFTRYQERVLKDATLSKEAVIRQYFSHNWNQVGLEIDDEVEAVFKCFEGHYNDEVISLVFATSEGYCFGERHGKVSVMKTIITEEMLSEKQQRLFPAIRALSDEANKALFGASWNPPVR